MHKPRTIILPANVLTGDDVVWDGFKIRPLKYVVQQVNHAGVTIVFDDDTYADVYWSRPVEVLNQRPAGFLWSRLYTMFRLMGES